MSALETFQNDYRWLPDRNTITSMQQWPFLKQLRSIFGMKRAQWATKLSAKFDPSDFSQIARNQMLVNAFRADLCSYGPFPRPVEQRRRRYAITSGIVRRQYVAAKTGEVTGVISQSG
jgi:hypothetical protein